MPKRQARRVWRNALTVSLGGAAVVLFSLHLLPREIRWYPYAFVDIGTGLANVVLVAEVAIVGALLVSVAKSLADIAKALEEAIGLLEGNRKKADKVLELLER